MTNELTNQELIKRYRWGISALVLAAIFATLPTTLAFGSMWTLITYLTGWTIWVTALVITIVVAVRRQYQEHASPWVRFAVVLGAVAYIAGLVAIYVSYLIRLF